MLRLRLKLMLEEMAEVIEAVSRNIPAHSYLAAAVQRVRQAMTLVSTAPGYEFSQVDLPQLAKELTDELYVTYGTGHVCGFPMDVCFDETHSSNMSKVGEDGKPIYRSDGKVEKGPNYRPADMAKILFGEQQTQDQQTQEVPV